MAISNSVSVALIDSGIGGFSVLQQIELACPSVSIDYFMDHLYLPYGELEQSLLLQRLVAIVEFLLITSPDIIVIACNTASTQLLDHLRDRFSLPFVGVVPAIKPAAALTNNGKVGLLATPATINSPYTQALINRFAPNCEVKMLGSSQLVHLAEQYFWQQQPLPPGLSFEPLAGIDTLVLGCTHFPLIAEALQRRLPTGIKLVDSGAAVANRVASILAERQSEFAVKSKTLYTSRLLEPQQQQKLAQMGFTQIKLTELS